MIRSVLPRGWQRSSGSSFASSVSDVDLSTRIWSVFSKAGRGGWLGTSGENVFVNLLVPFPRGQGPFSPGESWLVYVRQVGEFSWSAVGFSNTLSFAWAVGQTEGSSVSPQC